jgi:ferredoxin-NADP reductase
VSASLEDLPPIIERAVWRRATIVAVESVTAKMVGITLRPERWIPHVSGQYYDLRLPDVQQIGAFSIVSPPTVTDYLEFGVTVQPKGLLTPRLAKARSGDPIEIRGPVGRGFTWTPETAGRLVLIGAGAGVTPLLSMYTHALASGAAPPIVIISAKRGEDIFGIDRLPEDAFLRLTDTGPRIDSAYIAEALSVSRNGNEPLSVRICGPLGFIGTAVEALRSVGIPDNVIRSEGFV